MISIKRISIVLILLFALPCLADNGASFYGSGHGVAAGGGGCPACSLDIDVAAFSADPTTDGWIEDNGNWVGGSYLYCSDAYQDNFLRHPTTVTAGTCQWAGVGLSTQFGSDSNPGVFLQATGATGYRDVIRYDVTNTQFEWVVFDGSSEDEVVDTISDSGALGTGDWFYAQRTSSGYDIWVNPVGTCPDNWGAADYSLTGTPTHTASGTYVGIFESHGVNATTFSDFEAGD